MIVRIDYSQLLISSGSDDTGYILLPNQRGNPNIPQALGKRVFLSSSNNSYIPLIFTVTDGENNIAVYILNTATQQSTSGSIHSGNDTEITSLFTVDQNNQIYLNHGYTCYYPNIYILYGEVLTPLYDVVLHKTISGDYIATRSL